jgi:hypothetical protein
LTGWIDSPAAREPWSRRPISNPRGASDWSQSFRQPRACLPRPTRVQQTRWTTRAVRRA